jgi:hypothetical protein
MKGKIAALAALALACGLAMGQERPQAYEFKDGVAIGKAEGKTLDEAWAAVTKTLMVMNWNIPAADKASGTLTARKGIPAGASWTNLKEEEMPSAQIIINAAGGVVEILARWQNPRNTGAPFVSYKKDRKKFLDTFFSKVTEALK